MINYYEIVKLPEQVTHEEIESTFSEFKNELLKFSPGVYLSEEELRMRQKEKWEAFDVLLDEEKRKSYDEALERDRIHRLYEEQNKLQEETEEKALKKWKYIGIGTTILITVVYFLQQQISANVEPEKPIWRTHNITDEVKIQLPADIDSIGNFLPINFAKRTIGYVSELSGGFSVTVGWLEMDEGYSLSFRDVGYIGSREMHDMHRRFETKDTVKLNMAIHNYNTQLITGTYQIDNVIRAYENYTLIRGNQVIKVIINYVPDNVEHEKYCKRIFNSLTCY